MMKKVELRRGHVIKRGGMMGKRAIMLSVALFFIFVVLLSSFAPNKSVPQKAIIKVSFLKNNQYLIGKDTTDYDNFASVLKEKISAQKGKQIELNIRIPKDKNVGEINDILQIANAFEGIDLKLSTE